MKPVITVIDYGVGNLFSVRRAFETMGADVAFASNPDQIAAAERLVLPGVGAFKNGMDGLRKHELIETIRTYARSGRPFLGICLGMQMMLDESEEFGRHEGLGLIPGKVDRIPDQTIEGAPLKIPHVAWDGLIPPHARPESWTGTIFAGLKEGSCMYFVHSYAAVPARSEHILATVNYGGKPVVAAVASGNMVGCQFHPERSGPLGLKIIENFIRLQKTS